MITDCKVINAKIGHRDVKVIVEMHNPGSYFSNSYAMKVHLVGESGLESTIKGDFSLIKLTFESFTTIHANEFAERMYRLKERQKDISSL